MTLRLLLEIPVSEMLRAWLDHSLYTVSEGFGDTGADTERREKGSFEGFSPCAGRESRVYGARVCVRSWFDRFGVRTHGRGIRLALFVLGRMVCQGICTQHLNW